VLAHLTFQSFARFWQAVLCKVELVLVLRQDRQAGGSLEQAQG